MFISCRHITKDAGFNYYEIEDSVLGKRTFEQREAKVYDINDLHHSAYMTATVLEFYITKTNENVPKNMALFYLWWNTVNRHRTRSKRVRNPEFEWAWLDTYYPELNYGRRYIRCVLRQIKKQQFITRKKI